MLDCFLYMERSRFAKRPVHSVQEGAADKTGRGDCNYEQVEAD